MYLSNFTVPDFQDLYLAELAKYVVMGPSPSATTAGAVPMEIASVITTLSQSVVALIKHLVLVSAWRETLGMTSIRTMFPLVGVVEAVLILPWTRTKQTLNNSKRAMT